MASTAKINTEDLVYEVVNANLAGGLLCIPSATATVSGLQGIQVAGDAAQNCLGVTSDYSVTEANRAAAENTTNAYGYNDTAVGIPSATVTVYNQAIVRVTYTAAAVLYGDPICCAAAGAVRKWVSGTDSPAAIIGWCAEPGGVSSAGGLKKARINR